MPAIYHSIVLVFIISHVCVSGMNTEDGKLANIRDNKCGENLSFSFEQGTLTIFGTGEMFDYNGSYSPPWRTGRYDVLNVIIEKGVTSIGNHAFDDFENITSVTIPDGVTSIGEKSFFHCVKLQDVLIPDSVLLIDTSAFQFSTALAHFALPDHLQTIGDSAFSHTGASSLRIPETVKTIGKEAFRYCAALTFFEVDERNVNYKAIDGVLFNHKCDSLIQYPCGINRSSYIVPDGVISIEDWAFAGSRFLKSITIPDSVASIGNSSFNQCYYLTSFFTHGLHDIPTTALLSHSDLNTVCVPPDCNLTTFCRVSVTSDSEVCRTFQSLFNRCFTPPSYKDGQFIQEKRMDVKEWEKLSDGCMEYKCINETGTVFRSICNSSDEITRVCLNRVCKDQSEVKKTVVIVDLEEGVNLTEMNGTDLLNELIELCGISPDGITIGWESDSNGAFTRLIVYVDDDEVASIIEYSLTNLDKGEGKCQHALLCRTKSVHVRLMEQVISLSSSINGMFMETVVGMVIMMVINVCLA